MKSNRVGRVVKILTTLQAGRTDSVQKFSLNSDGSVTMEFRVDDLGEISRWILGYGDQVQALLHVRGLLFRCRIILG